MFVSFITLLTQQHSTAIIVCKSPLIRRAGYEQTDGGAARVATSDKNG
jgi:hypothetical protein